MIDVQQSKYSNSQGRFKSSTEFLQKMSFAESDCEQSVDKLQIVDRLRTSTLPVSSYKLPIAKD